MSQDFKHEGEKVPYLVSIILPIYNIKEDFLTHCVASICKQTYKSLEIILVDDGSNENVALLCDSLSLKDKRIMVIHQENNGVSVARNNGFEASHGDYVCFVDPDDWVSHDYVRNLLNAIIKSGADFAQCDCIVHYNNKEVDNKFLNKSEGLLKGEQKNLLLYQLIGKGICSYYPPEIAVGTPWAKIFRRSFIEKNKLIFPPKMIRMQDNIFSLYAIEAADGIYYLPEKLYHYRKEIGSASHSYNPNIIEYFERYFDETLNFLKKYQKEDLLYQALKMKELTSFNSYLAQYFFNPDNPHDYKKNVKKLDELLQKPRYQDALKNINYGILTTQERFFVFCLKHRLYSILRALVYIRSMYKM